MPKESQKDILRLDGRAAVVTGGGSGIGRAIACRLAERGARVGVLDLAQDHAEETTRQIESSGGVALSLTADVTSAKAVSGAFDQIESEFGPLRVVINNAGIAAVGSVTNTDVEDLDRLYEVNVKGVYHGIREAVNRMKAHGQGGAITNLASIASLIGVADRFAYSMTKGAVLSMTYSTAIDHLPDGIRCNCVCPARVHTPFVDGYLRDHFPGQEAEMFKTLSQYQPIGRMGTPEEVATLVLYLSCDESSFITGAALPLDGGVLTAR